MCYSYRVKGVFIWSHWLGVDQHLWREKGEENIIQECLANRCTSRWHRSHCHHWKRELTQ